MLKTFLALLGIVIAIGACSTPGTDRTVAESPVSPAESLAAWSNVYPVAVSARCVNCHSPTDRPWQGELTSRHVHTMNVQREIDGLGGSCLTCHGKSNWDQPHLPPGTKMGWTMPTTAKGYTPTTSSHDLCEEWKSGNRNFFEDAAYFQTGKKRPRLGQDLIDHVTDAGEGLVAWSFAPGPGRDSAWGTHQGLIANVTEWVKGGMQCPK